MTTEVVHMVSGCRVRSSAQPTNNQYRLSSSAATIAGSQRAPSPRGG
jgi:hypothetical protein